MDEQEVLARVGWPAEHARQLGTVVWVAQNYDAQDPTEAWDATQARVKREPGVIELRAMSIGRSGVSNALACIRFELDPHRRDSWRVMESEIGDPPLRVPPEMTLDVIDAMRDELEPDGQFRPSTDRAEPSIFFDAPDF